MENTDKVRKVIAWRIISTIIGTLISYFYIGSISKSLELTIIIGFTMTVIHYFFELWWEKNVPR